MKNTLYRLLSALLALCMVVGTFTAVLSSSVISVSADETEDEVILGTTTSAPFEIEDLVNVKYSSAEDKLKTMSKVTPLLDKNGDYLTDDYGQVVYQYAPWIVSGDYELYVQDKSGEIAVKNTKTGQVIFSNPYDVMSHEIQSSLYQEMLSQLKLTYEIIKEGKSGQVMNSYTDAAVHGNQIKVSYIKNGVCVEYTIGRADQRRLVPMIMEKYRWETVLYQKIEDTAIQKKFRAFYTLVDLNHEYNAEAEINRYKTDYPVLKKYNENKSYVSEGYDPTLASEYEYYPYYTPLEWNGSKPHDKNDYIYGVPYTGNMSLYVLGNATDQEKNRIEEYIRSWIPEYNYDTLAYDHELVEYTSTAAAIPLFKMALEYRLDEDGFNVRLPANSITFDEDNFRLTSIDVLPYMGAGSSENSGYTFIPDGSGTLIRFEDIKERGLAGVIENGTMYGPDNAYHKFSDQYTGKTEEMRYPVFGIIENDKVVFLETEDGKLAEVCQHRYITKTLEPDCTLKRDGGEYKYCAICGHLDSVSDVVPYAHTGSLKAIRKENCHQTGLYEITCSVCKQTDIQEVPATEHDYQEVILADTENHVCYVIQQCTTQYEKLDENGERVLDADGNVIMLECGQIDETFEKVEVEHTYDDAAEQVHHENGRCYVTNTCVECGYALNEDIDHTFEGEAETVYDRETHRCYTTQYCTACKGNVITEIDHDLADPTYKSDADGLCVKSEVCKNCGFEQITKDRHIAADDGVKKSDAQNHYCYIEFTCENCAEKYTVEANHAITDGKCTDCGFTESDEQTVEYLCENGKCYRVVLDKDGKEVSRVAIAHEYGDSIYVEPTCTEWGYTAFECVKCGYRTNIVYQTEDELAAPVGHDYQWDKEEKKNCLEGYTSHLKCTYCGDVQESKEVEADGHIYGEPECIVKETETNKGVYMYTCTEEGCGHVYMETRDPIKVEEDVTGGETEGDQEAEGDTETPDEEVEEEKYVEIPVSHGFVAIMTAGSSLATLKAGYHNLHPYFYAYMTVNPRPQDSYNLKDAVSSGSDAVWTVVSERKYSGSYSLKYIMLQNVDESVTKAPNLGEFLADSTYDATYAGMANAYRQYLIKNGDLTILEATEAGIPLYLEAFGATTISSSFLTFPTVETVPLTTFEDLKAIVNELKADKNEDGEVKYSISNINLKLNGFTNGGMISTVPYKVEFESVVGGNAGFSDFVSFANSEKVGVYPEFEFAYVETTDWFDGYSDEDHAVKTIDGRFIAKRDYDATFQVFTGTGLIAISASVYDYLYDGFSKNFEKFGSSGISVSSLGTDLNSDFDEDEPYNREDSREFTERLLAKLAKDYSVMIDGGNAYAIPYADHILNMSLTGSEHLYTSDSVPFMSMVLHGCVNYSGSATNMSSSLDLEILHIIENGASPYFIIATQNTKYLKENNSLSKYYSVDYSTWKEDMLSTYETLNESLKDVQNAQFTYHGYVNGYRFPDADENNDEFQESSEIIIKAIKSYLAAEERYNRAVALIERTTVTEVVSRLENDQKNGIIDILNKYEWASLEDSKYEAMDVKLTDEELAAIYALKAEIEEYLAIGSTATIKSNLSAAREAFAQEKIKFENTMAQYEYLYNIDLSDPANRLNADLYRIKDNFRGAVYEKDGKYVIASEGKVDAEGNPVKSVYEISDGSIVKVGYDNGVEFCLNYNYYDVIVTINGEQQVIGAYDFIKVKN